jgi:multiple antibiotic resistance protein
MREFWLAFLPMFVAVDPIGMIPVFLSLTGDMAQEKRRRVIIESMITALIVALGFLAVGRAILNVLGVTIADFLIAGGLLLFVLALADILSTADKPRNTPHDEDLGPVPLGVPLVVGPAVLATSLLLLNQHGALITVLAIAANVLLSGIIMYWSGLIVRLLGNAGSRVVSKLASLILAAFAVMFVRRGIAEIVASWVK